MSNDDFDDSRESFGRRKDRRKPRSMRQRKQLVDEGAEATVDSGLAALVKKGLISELGEQVRSGKEATVFRAVGANGPLAAKVYSDPEVRGFQSDERYRIGRYVADRRIRKILGSSKRRGLDPDLAHWVYHEYQMLWRVHALGVRVPVPAVGPDPLEIVDAGRIVLMEWIGDEEPAPRLSDVALDAHEAGRAWEGARGILERLLSDELVHGDLSTFNLLWWQGEVVLIDMPQAVEVERNPSAGDLLERDVRSMTGSFRKLGIEVDPDQLLAEVRVAAGYPASGRLTR